MVTVRLHACQGCYSANTAAHIFAPMDPKSCQAGPENHQQVSTPEMLTSWMETLS